MEHLEVFESGKHYPVHDKFTELFLRYHKYHNVTANNFFGENNRLLYDVFDAMEITITIDVPNMCACIHIQDTDERINIQCSFMTTRKDLELKAFNTAIAYVMGDFENYEEILMRNETR